MPKIYILFLFLLVIACGSKNRCYINYGFKFPLSVTPKDVFSIGDTIWYEMNLSNQLLDENTGNYIDLTDYELFFDLTIGKVDTDFIYSANHLFDIHSQIGKISKKVNHFHYTYLHFSSINEKHFKIGLIPTQKGCYETEVSLADIFIEKEENDELNITETECWEKLWPDTYAFTNNGQCNHYLVDGICQYSPYDSTLACSVDSVHYTKGAYAFCVKD
ncbi:hypothetical protein [Aureispira anguillae]|uniref:Lipoprotein n=1 Tax=Aureispira anguillae TaxID=2864201 RepID=A0A916DTU6_9BACT|nr:hypothetical protein [Aureispira anguillae]BDS13569.1 hypothetical protein AsAng_0043080 [Aureispira anguillae]